MSARVSANEDNVTFGIWPFTGNYFSTYKQGPEEVSLAVFRKVAFLIGNNVLQGDIISVENTLSAQVCAGDFSMPQVFGIWIGEHWNVDREILP